MSEVDESGSVLRTFTDVTAPQHLLTDSEGRVMVADHDSDRILLLNSELLTDCDLIDRKQRDCAFIKLRGPERLSYNEHTSHLCVVHSSGGMLPDVISVFSLRHVRRNRSVRAVRNFFATKRTSFK